MATAEKEYVRLPGRGSVGGWSSFFGISRTSCTLWLAADHLLQTELASGLMVFGSLKIAGHLAFKTSIAVRASLTPRNLSAWYGDFSLPLGAGDG